MWNMNKKLILWLSIVTAVVTVAATVVLIVALSKDKPKKQDQQQNPVHVNTQNTMDPNGSVTVTRQSDGTLLLSWPAGTNAQEYQLQITDTDGTVLYTCSTGAACECVLPELPADRALQFKITSSNNAGEKPQPGDAALEVEILLADPEITNLEWAADTEKSQVDMTFDMSAGQLCRIYMATGEEEPQLVDEVTEGKKTLTFGDGKDYPLPEYGAPLYFTFQLEKNADQVFYQGQITEGFTVTREHLMGNILKTECTDNGENSYTLTWNETKGETYEVRFSENGGNSWRVLEVIPAGEERSYTTDHLTPFEEYMFWVVAVGGQTLPDSEFAAHSEPVTVTTGAKLMYSTIWPIMDQPIYAAANSSSGELGTAAAGSTWCALGLEGQYIKVRFEGQDGYIDSEYCMVNMPEFAGDLCLYDITNSYSSIYLVHEFGISHVSGTVITGYEDVMVDADTYLVPVLYPTALKLVKAAQGAVEQGYQLKIYDSFRPKNATDKIYSLTYAILDTPVPVSTYSGKRVTDLDKLDWEPEKEEEEPVPTPDDSTEETPPAGTDQPGTDTTTPDTPTPDEPEQSEGTEETENTEPATRKFLFDNEEEEPWPGLMKGLTYKILMTNNEEYSLGAFLAPGNSRHNFGIALDLTLVDENGNELAMQTSMHDLSWYSASKRNNGNAYKLSRIMMAAGFKDLYSEWWHYQDDEIYQKNKYEPLKTGVSCEGWTKNDNGWRYRLADGSFYVGCTRTIDGMTYTFDMEGYTNY